MLGPDGALEKRVEDRRGTDLGDAELRQREAGLFVRRDVRVDNRDLHVDLDGTRQVDGAAPRADHRAGSGEHDLRRSHIGFGLGPQELRRNLDRGRAALARRSGHREVSSQSWTEAGETAAACIKRSTRDRRVSFLTADGWTQSVGRSAAAPRVRARPAGPSRVQVRAPRAVRGDRADPGRMPLSRSARTPDPTARRRPTPQLPPACGENAQDVSRVVDANGPRRGSRSTIWTITRSSSSLNGPSIRPVRSSLSFHGAFSTPLSVVCSRVGKNAQI